MKRICVFCGSSLGASPAFKAAADAMGAAIARSGREVVYGGGNVGLMGVVADAALAQGGRVIGVIPQALADKELAKHQVTELRVVASMHERKATMADLADAFIALPGGYGTWEEFCEVVTWAQLGMHRKPCGILNVEGFYDPLLAQMQEAVRCGFVKEEHRMFIQVEQQPEALLKKLLASPPPPVQKWIGRAET